MFPTRAIAITLAAMLTGCGGASFSSTQASETQGAPDADRSADTEGADAVRETDAADADAAAGESVDAARPADAIDADSGLSTRDASGRDAGSSADAGSAETGTAPDAGHEEASSPPACTSDLSGVGVLDFRIAFTLTTGWAGPVGSELALVSQRAGGCVEDSVFWDVLLDNTGGVVAATGDGSTSSYVYVEAGVAANDGKPHRVTIVRASGKLSVVLDGVTVSATALDAYAFGAFPALAVGSDSCGAVTPLGSSGSVADLCITTGTP